MSRHLRWIPFIECTMDQVLIHNRIIERPDYVSAGEWYDYWDWVKQQSMLEKDGHR